MSGSDGGLVGKKEEAEYPNSLKGHVRFQCVRPAAPLKGELDRMMVVVMTNIEWKGVGAILVSPLVTMGPGGQIIGGSAVCVELEAKYSNSRALTS